MSSTIDETTSNHGTPMATRSIITMGEVKGISEKIMVLEPSGLVNAISATINAKTRGMVMGNMNCWVSASLSTAAPTAANSEA